MNNINTEENQVKNSPNKTQKIKESIKEILYIIILSLIIVLPIRIFIAQPYIVSGASMDKTYQSGNYLIINEIFYRFKEPKRGDVIVFKAPPPTLILQNLPINKTIYYIKRIIGVPGDTVEINGDEVKIYNEENLEGKILSEPYVYINKLIPSPLFSNIKLKIILKNDEYFVMGDNRHNSSDSRLWGILPRKNIIGKSDIRLFPINKISISPGEYREY
ncbi:MAG: signal peptidase I [bacterium]